MRQPGLIIFFLFVLSGAVTAVEFTENESVLDGHSLGSDFELIDVDGDSDLDVVSVNYTGVAADSEVYWHENDGGGGFTINRIANSNVSGELTDVCAGDVDGGDGDIDFFTVTMESDLHWYENDGSESFTVHFIDDSGSGTFDYCFFSDVDDDGDGDVVVSSSYFDVLFFYENDGSENFTKNTIGSSMSGMGEVFVSDIDGDGNNDLIIGNEREDFISWYENDGLESFTEHNVSVVSGNGDPRYVYVIDLDEDGDNDVLIGAGKHRFMENDGSESFTEKTIDAYDSSHGGGIYADDLDNDGDVDVTDGVFWFENDGSESFTEHSIVGAFSGAGKPKIGDVDVDGDNDIVVSGFFLEDISWFENLCTAQGDCVSGRYCSLSQNCSSDVSDDASCEGVCYGGTSCDEACGGQCSSDFDGSDAWCVDAAQCGHDSVRFNDTDQSCNAAGSSDYTCNSGSWSGASACATDYCTFPGYTFYDYGACNEWGVGCDDSADSASCNDSFECNSGGTACKTSCVDQSACRDNGYYCTANASLCEVDAENDQSVPTDYYSGTKSESCSSGVWASDNYDSGGDICTSSSTNCVVQLSTEVNMSYGSGYELCYSEVYGGSGNDYRSCDGASQSWGSLVGCTDLYDPWTASANVTGHTYCGYYSAATCSSGGAGGCGVAGTNDCGSYYFDADSDSCGSAAADCDKGCGASYDSSSVVVAQLLSGVCYYDRSLTDSCSRTESVENCPAYCASNVSGGSTWSHCPEGDNTVHSLAFTEYCHYGSESCADSDGCDHPSTGTLRANYCDVCTDSYSQNGLYCPVRGTVSGSSCYFGAGSRSCSGSSCTLSADARPTCDDGSMTDTNSDCEDYDYSGSLDLCQYAASDACPAATTQGWTYSNDSSIGNASCTTCGAAGSAGFQAFDEADICYFNLGCSTTGWNFTSTTPEYMGCPDFCINVSNGSGHYVDYSAVIDGDSGTNNTDQDNNIEVTEDPTNWNGAVLRIYHRDMEGGYDFYVNGEYVCSPHWNTGSAPGTCANEENCTNYCEFSESFVVQETNLVEVNKTASDGASLYEVAILPNNSCNYTNRTDPGSEDTCYYSDTCTASGCSLSSSAALRANYCDACGSSGVSQGEFCPAPNASCSSSCADSGEIWFEETASRTNDCVAGVCQLSSANLSRGDVYNGTGVPVCNDSECGLDTDADLGWCTSNDSGSCEANSPPSKPSVVYPTNGSTVGSDRPVFDWSSSTNNDSDDRVYYELLVANNSAFAAGNLTIDYTNLSESSNTSAQDLHNETYYWKVRACDNSTASNNCSAWEEEYAFTVDMTFPVISINTPEASDFVNYSTVKINASSDVSVDFMWYNVNGTNVSVCESCDNFSVNSPTLSEDVHNLTVYGNSTPGNNVGELSIQFDVDLTAPAITISGDAPADGERINSTYTDYTLDASLSDAQIATCDIEFNGSNESATYTNSSCEVEVSSLEDGENYTYKFYVFDEAEHESDTVERWFLINTQPVTDVRINEPVRDATDATCQNTSTSDAEGDSLEFNYSWAVNGVLQENYTDLNVLESGMFVVDDVLTCNLTPFDGFENGSKVNASYTVISADDSGGGGGGGVYEPVEDEVDVFDVEGVVLNLNDERMPLVDGFADVEEVVRYMVREDGSEVVVDGSAGRAQTDVNGYYLFSLPDIRSDVQLDSTYEIVIMDDAGMPFDSIPLGVVDAEVLFGVLPREIAYPFTSSAEKLCRNVSIFFEEEPCNYTVMERVETAAFGDAFVSVEDRGDASFKLCMANTSLEEGEIAFKKFTVSCAEYGRDQFSASVLVSPCKTYGLPYFVGTYELYGNNVCRSAVWMVWLPLVGLGCILGTSYRTGGTGQFRVNWPRALYAFVAVVSLAYIGDDVFGLAFQFTQANTITASIMP